jgi:pyruvate carboxylase subunit A
MFKKVLIANRGDIAVRIIRSLRLLGISPLTIFSEADKQSSHVRLADESFSLGSGTLHDTYMNKEKIIEAASWLEADAIHPGYSFLSDDPEFADMVSDAGFTWIGPSGKVLKQLGGKLEAKKVAKKVGFQIVPGSDKAVSNFEEAKKICDEIGYPVIVKSNFGGGGLGIRVVTKENELEKALEEVIGQGRSSFVQDDVFIEKYIESIRNIEFGFLSDHNGNTIVFPEREATIQFINQKLFSETPSLVISDEQRFAIHELILKLVKQTNYSSLGNLEFIFNDGKLYFSEANNHIQLEHPITEMVTGIDNISHQINVAQGLPLSLHQSDIKVLGHAMSFRINAEDPIYDFQPSSGTIKEIEVPGGPGVRFDTSLYRGYTTSSEYDTFLGQLVIFGNTRDDAIKRSEYIFKEFTFVGLANTLLFHRHLIQHPNFLQNNLSTNFITESNIIKQIKEEFFASVAALFSVRKHTSKVILPPLSKSRWRDTARREGTGQ